MAIEVGTNEPTCFTIGHSVSWIRTEEEYPAPTWSLIYGFSGPIRFQVLSVADTTNHKATMPLTGIAPGDYVWTVRATDGTSTITLDKGSVRALPDLTVFDAELEAAEERLAALESAYLSSSGGAYTSVSVDGVAFSRGQSTDLKANLQFARREVERLKAQRTVLLGKAVGNLHLTHFLIR